MDLSRALRTAGLVVLILGALAAAGIFGANLWLLLFLGLAFWCGGSI